MGKIKDTLTILGGLGFILGVGVLLIGGFGLFFVVVQWLWRQIPFGISGFILGTLIIAVTFILARQFFPKRKVELSWHFLLNLGGPEVIGYLYGLVIILASFLWFFLPNSIFRILPSFGSVLGFSLFASLLIYGIGGCLTAGILGFREHIRDGLFYIGCALVCFWAVNAPIWSTTERIPNDHYILGKAVFAFIVFLELLYISFFHLFPAIRIYRGEDKAD